MLTGLYKLGAGMAVHSRNQMVVARNIAGSNLPGFRGEFLVSETFRTSLQKAVGGNDNHQISRSQVLVNHSPGPVHHTGRSLDFAIQGRGFFMAESPNGEQLLTRNGDFQLGADGALLTQEGYPVIGHNGKIRLAATDAVQNVQTRPDGTIYLQDEIGLRDLGRLKIVDVENHNALTRVSANYFTSRRPVFDAKTANVTNRAREGANVSNIREMVTMLETVRQYESAQRMLKMQDELIRRHEQTVSS